ncbi:MAG: hypothetical protein JNK78_04975 [Planctomycetes bacterium]|nr:hypothetical protein [Planctomycetota bacterium]
MTLRFPPSLFLLCVFGANGAAPAQDLQTAFASVGAHRTTEGARLVGPGYTARVDRDGLEFVPLLGSNAPREFPLRVRPVSMHRGEIVVWERGDESVATLVESTSLRREHGTVTEVYEAKVGGVEQSFVVAERPVGAGDLVVHLEFTTDLRLAFAAADGLRYEADGIGGVTVGAVTGVDARGARCAGALRVEGTNVEYVLPAEFVDRAAYPLVVDPLFGSAFFVGNAAVGTDDAPDVAFDATTLNWLVTWRVATSATTGEVRAQLVSFTGTPIGSNILVDTSASATHRPRVANVNATDKFVLASVHRTVSGSIPFHTLQVRTVDAATGAVSSALGILSASPGDFVVGGDSRAGFFGFNENAVLVYMATASGSTDTTSVLIHGPSSGAPTVASGFSTLHSTSGSAGHLAVTRHAGNAGRWLVVWGSDFFGGTPPFDNILGRVVDSVGSVCTPVVSLASFDVQTPAVATRDGTSFALAWRNDLTNRVNVRPITYAGPCSSGTLTPGVTSDPVSASGLGSAPAIDFATDKYVLAWRQSNLLSPTHVRVKSLDPATCGACSAEQAVETSAAAQNDPAVAAWWSGSSALGDTALVVWEDAGVIRARRHEATGGGGYAGLAGGCGAGTGVVDHVGSPVLGDSTFALALTGASAPVIGVVIGLSELSAPCGPCTIVPALDIVLGGGGPHPIPVPCDLSWLGLQFWSQWVLLVPGGCSLVPDLGFSSARRYTIGD